MIELELIPARQGDAIWMRWPDGDRSRQLVIDMGTQGVGSRLRERFAGLPPDQRAFELLVITHIDADHIGGAVSCLVNEDLPAGLEFADIWFNGLEHLTRVPLARARSLEDMGGVQGKKLMDWLAGRAWNRALGGQRVCREDERPLPCVELAGGLRLTVLGPTPARLAALEPTWKAELAAAMRKKLEREGAAAGGGLEAMGRRRPVAPVLPDAGALSALAAGATGGDTSKPNGTSIVLLVEHGDARILLAGDAYANDLVAGLALVDGGRPVKLDAFKLPHHGSRDNTTRALIQAVDCPLFLFSTDGTQFFHPDAAAVACVIDSAGAGVELGFNQRSDFTAWWDNPEWKERFGYRTQYGNDAAGLLVRFC